MDPKFFRGVKYEHLMHYTDNFSDENCIGRFQFGKIYKGNIDYGIPGVFHHVAVKIWDTSSSSIRDNELRLMREVIFLRNEEVKCRPTAPELLGYVLDGQHLGVIYELKAVNNLCTQLCKDEFNWLQRIKVGLWFARLVKFFHNPTPPHGPFLIRNIDASHILLDEDCIPKLFDFSLMTGGGIFPRDPQHEAERSRKLTGEQDDVFSFGRLLLCLISKQVMSKDEDVESVITQWNNQIVMIVMGHKSVSLSLVHPSFEADTYFNDCDGSQFSDLVMECFHSIPDKRPSMEQVVERLEKLQVIQNHVHLLEVKPKPPSKYWW